MNAADLTDIDEPDDPRITQAAGEIVEGLKRLREEPSLGPEVAAALYDAIAEGLDALIDETDAMIAEDASEDDLLAEDDDTDDDLLIATDE